MNKVGTFKRDTGGTAEVFTNAAGLLVTRVPPEELPIPIQSPWGRVSSSDRIAPGIVFVSTAGHGGFYISNELLPKVPQALQDYAAKWSKGWGARWYEEDCCAAIIPYVFAEHFTAENVTRARQMLEQLGKIEK